MPANLSVYLPGYAVKLASRPMAAANLIRGFAHADVIPCEGLIYLGIY